MKRSSIVMLWIVAVFGSKAPPHLQIIKQNSSSSDDIRLTCHSLGTFIFILQANLKKPSAPTHTLNLLWFNRRCAGQQHCRFNLAEDYPGWHGAKVHIEYACISDTAVHRYCNMKIIISDGETGYIKSPGYPLYYTGVDSCRWTFHAAVSSQKISLIFHDLNIRNPTPNGDCIDLVRIRDDHDDDDDKQTLYQSCGTQVGTEIHSKSNKITLEFISKSNISTLRGFFVQYKAVGCPRINLKTIKCSRAGYVYPDSQQFTRTLACDEQQGRWNESIESIPQCISASSAAILKASRSNRSLANLSDNNAMNAADSSSTPSPTGDIITDMVVPGILIAMLLLGNAAILYAIFRYKKRKLPRLGVASDEMALSSPSSSSSLPPRPQV